MKKRKNSRKTKESGKHFAILTFAVLLLVVLIGLLLWTIDRQKSVIGAYETVGVLDNQACLALKNQPNIHAEFALNLKASAQPRLVYSCLIGAKTKADTIHGKPIDSYQMGASVMYFHTNEAAEKFAADELNPLRYWSPEDDGQNMGSPTQSPLRYTFIVTNVKKPYFDSYSVKGNTVIRISLPCKNKTKDLNNNITACDLDANAGLVNTSKAINELII